MTGSTRTIETPRGAFVLRPERLGDERFLFDLFVADHLGILHQAGLPQETIEQLIDFQFRSQTTTYRTMFPDAIYSIVSWGGMDIGRFVEHDETDVVYFVDFVLLPAYQAKGLGSALTRALMEEWAARDRGTRVKILINNTPSLTMCRKLGFVESSDQDAGMYVELRWYPPQRRDMR